jgi:hypothetical protein
MVTTAKRAPELPERMLESRVKRALKKMGVEHGVVQFNAWFGLHRTAKQIWRHEVREFLSAHEISAYKFTKAYASLLLPRGSARKKPKSKRSLRRLTVTLADATMEEIIKEVIARHS